MTQFDRGAIPSIISQTMVDRLRLPLIERSPTRVQGIGGVVTVTQECLLFIRVAGTSMRTGHKNDEGVYGIRCLVARESPVPLLIGCVTMDNCGFHVENDEKVTIFGNPNTRVYMLKPWEEWDDVRRSLRYPSQVMTIRDSVAVVLQRTGHMTPEELGQTCPRLPKPVRTEMADLLVHMARVQESISGFIHDQLSLLESLDYSKLPENDDDVDDLHADYSLSEDPTGKPPEVPSES
jgi:hypothetical protein